MSYCTIEGRPVFLTHERASILEKNALSDLGPEELIRLHIATPDPEWERKSCEAQSRMFDYLANIALTDPERFIREWVWFDLEGKNAFENAWDLLYDYCDYYGIGNLIEVESTFAQRLLDEVEYSTYTHPMGLQFYLDFSANPKALRVKPARILHNSRILIDTRTILQMRGTLDHFVVIMETAVLDCGPDLIFKTIG